MAEESMLFTQFNAGSSVCALSRASLMTCKHQGYASVLANRPDQLVSDNEYTIAKVFKDAGYVTGAIGKWGVGHPPPHVDPQRKEDWKALRLNSSATRSGKEEVFEYYNLGIDPVETTNLADQHPELARIVNELFMTSRVVFEIATLIPTK
jgi:arylsulfatase A-like enzyme